MILAVGQAQRLYDVEPFSEVEDELDDNGLTVAAIAAKLNQCKSSGSHFQ